MPKLVFIERSGTRREVDAVVGTSVMLAATANLVDGIIGECGGCRACATCHVYVLPPWFERLAPPASAERDLLEAAENPRPNSRLGCQIQVTEEMDGMVLEVPQSLL